MSRVLLRYLTSNHSQPHNLGYVCTLSNGGYKVIIMKLHQERFTGYCCSKGHTEPCLY